MLRPVIAVFLLTATTLAAGCSAKVNKNDLVGHYTVVVHSEKQIIQINSDGTYDNEFRRGDSLVWRYRDRWSYGDVPGLGNDAITFDGFRFGLNGYGKDVAGFWPVEPEYSWSGAIELCFDPDLNGRCFVKDNG